MEEIKPGDLMIGNIVTVDNPQYHPKLKDVPLRVTGIQERSIQGEIECCVNLEHVNQKPNTYYDTYSQFLKFIHPIPLTEDILSKAGFKLDNNKNYWLSLLDLDKHLDLICVDGYYYPQLVQEPELSCDSLSIVSLNRITSLHELQNLFKILTGNDLKIEV